MAVSMLKKECNPSVQIKRVAMDNDTTTSFKLRKEIERHIEDLKDINHMKTTWALILYDQTFYGGGQGWWIGRGSSERCLKWGGWSWWGFIKGLFRKHLKTEGG